MTFEPMITAADLDAIFGPTVPRPAPAYVDRSAEHLWTPRAGEPDRGGPDCHPGPHTRWMRESTVTDAPAAGRRGAGPAAGTKPPAGGAEAATPPPAGARPPRRPALHGTGQPSPATPGSGWVPGRRGLMWIRAGWPPPGMRQQLWGRVGRRPA